MSQTKELLETLHENIGLTRDASNHASSMKEKSIRQFIHCISKQVSEVLKNSHQNSVAGEQLYIQKIIETARSQREMVYQLSIATGAILKPVCLKQLQQNREIMTAFLPVFSERMKVLRPNITSTSTNIEQQAFDVLCSIVFGGIQNAAQVSWSYLHMLLHTASDDTNYDALVDSVWNILKNLALSHEDVFDTLDSFLRDTQYIMNPNEPKADTVEPAFYWPLLRPENFLIHNNTVEIDPKIFTQARDVLEVQLKNNRRFGEPRVGCPAMAIIHEVYYWSARVSKICLQPNTEQILALPSEIALPPRKYPVLKQQKHIISNHMASHFNPNAKLITYA